MAIPLNIPVTLVYINEYGDLAFKNGDFTNKKWWYTWDMI
jgi:hypothetical protein